MAFTELARARLYNDARHRVDMVDLAPTVEIARDRRFLAFGMILGLLKAGALHEDQANELLDALQDGQPPPAVSQAFEAALCNPKPEAPEHG